jgi:hypothetical protein
MTIQGSDSDVRRTRGRCSQLHPGQAFFGGTHTQTSSRERRCDRASAGLLVELVTVRRVVSFLAEVRGEFMMTCPGAMCADGVGVGVEAMHSHPGQR